MLTIGTLTLSRRDCLNQYYYGDHRRPWSTYLTDLEYALACTYNRTTCINSVIILYTHIRMNNSKITEYYHSPFIGRFSVMIISRSESMVYPFITKLDIKQAYFFAMYSVSVLQSTYTTNNCVPHLVGLRPPLLL